MNMSESATNDSPLRPSRAFVVQFHDETDLGRGDCVGRLEHVVSGKVAHFKSREELLVSMAGILTAESPHPCPKSLYPSI